MSLFWKYAAFALAILAALAVAACLYFRASAAVADLRAAEAGAEADDLRFQVADLKASAKRDATSDALTEAVRVAAEARAPEQQERAQRVETLTRERIVQVPANCPSPDPDLMRELAEGSARVLGAENRLRGIRGAGDKAAR